MKKLLALSLALVMALGMTSVAFATGELAYTINGTGYRLTDGIVDNVSGGTKTVKPNTSVAPGWSVYYQIMNNASTPAGLTDSDQVKGATIKQTWDMGKEFVESVSVVKKKLQQENEYFYFLCVTYKPSTSTTAYDVAGEITVKKTTTTTSSGKTTGDPFTATLNLNTGYNFAKAKTLDIANETTNLFEFGKSGAIATESAGKVFDGLKDTALTTAEDKYDVAVMTYCKDPDAETAYRFTGDTSGANYNDFAALKTAAAPAGAADPLKPNYAKAVAYMRTLYAADNRVAVEGDQTFTTPGGHYFDVDVTGQSKILLYVDQKYNSTVAAVYPSANLDFVNFNNASFNKTGELTILADAGSYLYELKADGSLATIKNTYDEYEEAFKVTTRTLGKYVISDTELKLVAASSSASSSEAPASSTTAPVKTNPGTGAAA